MAMPRQVHLSGLLQNVAWEGVKVTTHTTFPHIHIRRSHMRLIPPATGGKNTPLTTRPPKLPVKDPYRLLRQI